MPEAGGSRLRIAAFVADDPVWGLPAWARTLPRLARDHDVVGLWTFPERLGTRTGMQVPLWYLRVFGGADFARLAAFALLRHARRLAGPVRDWAALARRHGCEWHAGESPNDPAPIAWLARQRIDVLFIMINVLLSPEALAAVRLGVINKHASVLPACRGVFPYVWAHLHGVPPGVSFHRVTAELDAGDLLVQRRLPEAAADSMLAFYARVFGLYPDMAAEAVAALARGERLAPPADVTPSRYPFPAPEDIRRLRAAGHAIARWRDLRLAFGEGP